eukprot:TRINITY_DN150_c0_g1_i2.p1 TRINITY_DN150_c0_g1~~TRINITY_DN150_c0_g1_i2.p1  ORF type:complete len:158 (-),score=50.22 TRINITY_DN150_c0_g1_i2:157-576(-)
MAHNNTRTIISTDAAPAAIGSYSQAVAYNGIVYVSGCIGLDNKTMEFTSETVAGQTQKVMENMKAILTSANSDFEHVLKTTILLRDISDFGQVNEVYSKFFPTDPPARATYAVAGLPRNALVEIECVAAVISNAAASNA